MSGFEPARPEGAEFTECPKCSGAGMLDTGTEDERECDECEGLGEWFE